MPRILATVTSQMLWPLAANNLSVISQMLWLLTTTNCGSRRQQNWPLNWPQNGQSGKPAPCRPIMVFGDSESYLYIIANNIQHGIHPECYTITRDSISQHLISHREYWRPEANIGLSEGLNID